MVYHNDNLLITRQVTIPQYGSQITLNGHQSKIIVTDFKFGSKTLLYSTAEVLTYAVIDGKEVLALWVPTGESGEFTVKGVNSAKFADKGRTANIEIHPGANKVTVSFMQRAGMSVVELGDGTRIVLLDRSAAHVFWSPPLNNDPAEAGNNTGKSTSMALYKQLIDSLTCFSPRPWSLLSSLG